MDNCWNPVSKPTLKKAFTVSFVANISKDVGSPELAPINEPVVEENETVLPLRPLADAVKVTNVTPSATNESSLFST